MAFGTTNPKMYLNIFSNLGTGNSTKINTDNTVDSF